MKNLPSEFLARMNDLLGDDYDVYLKSLDEDRIHGLRINTSKISVEGFLKIAPFSLTPIPWTDDGFYYEEAERPSKHPYYYAGLYYLQEPSAMLPAEVLPIEEGDLVLDCCASPGGKSSKLANRLKGSGMLLANDISVSRCQILLKTLESQGVRNACVIAEDVCRLDRFEEFFDKILVDAPCSGEGMFRKDDELIRSWKEKDGASYAPLQKEILMSALNMLKPGGMLVYSTCTFDPREDEEVVEYALDHMAGLKVLPIRKYEGFAEGLTPKTRNCVRLYPHRIKGEGHFVTLLQKNGEKKKTAPVSFRNNENEDLLPASFRSILKHGRLVKRNEKLYLLPFYELNTEKLRVLRSGLYLGELKHSRFEPSQALALFLNEGSYENTLNFDVSDERVIRYLKCETLDVKDKNSEGLVLVCVDHFPLGFGKVSGGVLKNRYPANYRYK